MEGRPQMLLVMGLYTSAVLALGFISRRYQVAASSFLEEYFMGSRSFGGLSLAMTLVATYVSASSFLGGPGAAYKWGLGWVFLAMIQVPVAFLTLSVLGKRLNLAFRRMGAITVNDFLRVRYGSDLVASLGAVFTLVFFVAAISAQLVGGARLLEVATGMSYLQSLLVFSAVVVIYTSFGGLRAVVWTDVLQGFVMTAGLFVLLFAALGAGGGVGQIVSALGREDPALLSPFGPQGFIAKPFILSFWVLVGFGVMGLPQTAIRCAIYRDSPSLHRGMVISTLVLGFMMLVVHLLGVFGRVLVPGIDVGDKVIPTLALKLLSPVLAGVFLAAPVAAIMSTVDSQLILASASAVKDLYMTYLDPNPSPGRISAISLATTLGVGVLAALAAVKPPQLLIWINLFAFGGLQAAFLWPLLLGLYWPRANRYGAMASMLVGVLSFVYLSHYKISLIAPRVHAIVPSLLFSLLAFVAVSLITPPPSEEELKPTR